MGPQETALRKSERSSSVPEARDRRQAVLLHPVNHDFCDEADQVRDGYEYPI